MPIGKGMLSSLFAPQGIDPEEAAEERRLQTLSGSGVNPLAYTAYSSGAQAGRGISKILGGLTGRDVRTPTAKRSDAIEAAKAQVAQMGFNPDDPKSIDAFYKNVIMILQKQGLAGEALDVSREWHTQKGETEKLRLEAEKLKAATAGATQKQIAATERNRILAEKNLPELERMIRVVEGFDPILEAPQRKMRMEALNAMLESEKKGIVLEDAGDRIIIRDRASGAQVGTPDVKGAVPLSAKEAAKEEKATSGAASAYANAIAKAQADYDAAVRLYNHPGIEGITGRVGRLVGEPGTAGQVATTAASASSRAALDLWKQIIGATFLAGLNELKAASPTGSTGLGQTSNIEGEKVQSAKAALARNQDAPDFRLNLKVYIQSLEGAADRLAEAAQRDDITPIPLQKKSLTGPTAVPSAPARPAAASAAPAAPGTGWSVKEKGK